ncbi:MAG: 50S ribosomal protein L11 [Candidatus Aenigmatarchaeota archaeon]
MAKETIEALVEGGKASAGPPLGPALGPMGVNTKKVVEDINEKTAGMKGMKVPVKVIIDTATKEYEIVVGTPPVAALIKKEIGIDKGSGKAGEVRVGDISMEQVKKIAKTKFGSDDKMYVNQVLGTCRSMGITVGEGGLSTEEEKAAKESTVQEKKEAKPAEGEAAEGEAEGKSAKDKEEGKEEKSEGKDKKPEGKKK